ncbi:subgroup IIa dihydroorotase [Cyanobacterium sp. HL-69]|uniref:dihydroorotase n=1 Tax=Cyanobacterium sp. HL-69 TaxID=2054282 RepID=UPI000CA0E0D8|nr:subgroup IIa dihydroorotase [Cyanobacterium sp. HL-69]
MTVKPNSRIYRQVRILDPVCAVDNVTDVLVIDGKIEQVGNNLGYDAESVEVMEGDSLILGPGLVDIYSISGEPGYEERETLESLAGAMEAGGFSRTAILPNTSPVMDNPATCAFLEARVRDLSSRFYLWGALTNGLKGEVIAELASLAEAGVVGFTDNMPCDNLLLLRRMLEYAHPFDLPVALSPCNMQLRGAGVVRENSTSVRLGLMGCPAVSETIAIASIVELVGLTKTKVHLMRVSTERGVKLIERAKEEGLPITASVNWHHLLLNSEAVESYDPNLKLEPPLGAENDRLALVEGIKNGVIDAIAVDHTPYTYEENTVAFAQSPSGAIGYELVLPLLWENLVDTRQISALKLWEALSVNPLRCLNQKPISLQQGEKAELILFSPRQCWQVTPQNLKSLSSNTYWLNQELRGKVLSN